MLIGRFGLTLVLAAWLADGLPPVPVTIALCSTLDDALAPPDRPGLARRAGRLHELRRQSPDFHLIEAGRLTNQPGRWPMLGRSLAIMGADVLAVGDRELAGLAAVTAAAQPAALPLTSLVSPAGTPPLPAAYRIDLRGGEALAVLSLAAAGLTAADLGPRLATEIAGLRADGVTIVLLVSHLDEAATNACLVVVPEAQRPELVAWTGGAAEPEPMRQADGRWWLPLGREGRAVTVIDLLPGFAGWEIVVERRNLEPGREEPAVARQVAAQLAAEAAGQATAPAGPVPSDPAPSRCASCHEHAVRAWRRHAHSQAVATLAAAGRMSSGCLRCHSQQIRSDGVAPAPGGDQGVTCATCHEGLKGHLDGVTQARPTTIGRDGCERCHSPGQSPAWDPERYRRHVHDACRGTVRERLR